MDSNRLEELSKINETDSSSDLQDTNELSTETAEFLRSILNASISSVDEDDDDDDDDCGDNRLQENEENIPPPEQEQPNETFVDPDWIKYSISTWYHDFKSVVPETHLIEIPKEIVQLFRNGTNVCDDTRNPIVKVFCRMLEATIQQVGGTAFIKDNWHAPKDASVFSLNNLLKVNTCCEAICYLTCSDLVMRDFERELGSLSFYLAVRRWIDIHPATEFRCIVVNKDLIGITPRDWPKFYGHFKESSQEIIDNIKLFYENNIRLKFSEKNFIFDILLPTFNECILWDFGPLNESTKLYAFSWYEIKNIIQEPGPKRSPVFRYLEEDTGILPFRTSYEYQDMQ